MEPVERQVIAVEGIVQGVGFRPFVFREATARGLRGSVRNDAGGVIIDVEGGGTALDAFLRCLAADAPAHASITRVRARRARPRSFSSFTIDASAARRRRRPAIAADLATCDDCLRELFDPADRRFRYPFLSCTQCGPRYTIVEGVPYDRARTTMARFPLCVACRAEYEDPADRRFHAQPLACHVCGPQLAFEMRGAERRSGEAALSAAVAALRSGRIVAIRGIGGFHLACAAGADAAVGALRQRKRRADRPFAVMVGSLDEAARLGAVDEAERALLTGPERPIVLLRRNADAHAVAPAVAPGLPVLGLMLPYTPLHALLLHDFAGPLVMTSGNRSDEPIAIDDDEARDRLAGIADAFLTHDRAIATRCDDSVVHVVAGAPAFVRRSRGWAPRPVPLPHDVPVPVAGLGAHLKNTFCLAAGRAAYLSHHIGDLDHPAARRALEETLERTGRLLGIMPRVVAHDLHPDYATTRLAAALPDVGTLAVQHHHAHVAACMAEHGVVRPVLGVAFDGTGLGTDGAIWGGEFLVTHGAGFERVAHLAYVPLPGGEAAVRHPARMAAAHLHAAFGGDVGRLPVDLIGPMEPAVRRLLFSMLENGVHAPPTSSVGRLFDAVSALTGVCRTPTYEGQPAIELEAAAGRVSAAPYAFDLVASDTGWIAQSASVIRAVVDDIVRGRDTAAIAAAFHAGVARLIADVAMRVRDRTGITTVALTGGVFHNVRLTEDAARQLERVGFDVLIHRAVPCGDGGIALGQAWVAALHAASGED